MNYLNDKFLFFFKKIGSVFFEIFSSIGEIVLFFVNFVRYLFIGKFYGDELKQFMIYAGRPGLWNDWVRFQGQARIRRQQEKESRKKRVAFIGEVILIAALILVFSAVVILFIWLGIEHNRRTA